MPIAHTEYSEMVMVVIIIANFLVHLECLIQIPICFDCLLALNKKALTPPAADIHGLSSFPKGLSLSRLHLCYYLPKSALKTSYLPKAG